MFSSKDKTSKPANARKYGNCLQVIGQTAGKSIESTDKELASETDIKFGIKRVKCFYTKSKEDYYYAEVRMHIVRL